MQRLARVPLPYSENWLVCDFALCLTSVDIRRNLRRVGARDNHTATRGARQRQNIYANILTQEPKALKI